MKKILAVAAATTIIAGVSAAMPALATEGTPHKAFVCKYVGTPGVDETLQTGQNPISVDFASLDDIPAIGVFFTDAQGRSVVIAINTGQPEPGVESCPPPVGPPPIALATGVTFTEATCTSAPSFTLLKTLIDGLGPRPFYNVEGPDLIDGHPVAGGTYTFTPISIVGYVLTGGTVFTHTFAAAPTECGTPPPPPPTQVTGTATVICDLGAQLYRLSGTIDGNAADIVTPATFPGSTKGVVEVIVRRGDTSFRTTVTLNGDCGPPTTVTPPPVSVTVPVTPPAATPPAAKPPAAKPPVKPKPTKPKKPKAAKPHKPTIHKCVPTKNGTKRVWVKGSGCHTVKPPQPEKLTG